MFYDIQTTSAINKFVTGHIRRSPNFRLSALFRKVREQDRINLLGDCPVLSYLIDLSLQNGRKFTRAEIRHAINQSPELKQLKKKEKTELLNNLFHRSNPTINQSNERSYERPFKTNKTTK